MSRTPTGIELIKRLKKKFGCRVVRRAKGSHCTIELIDRKADGKIIATSIQATSQELSIGVLKAISRKLKIPLEELVKD